MSTPPMRFKFGAPPPPRPGSRGVAPAGEVAPVKTPRTLPGRGHNTPLTTSPVGVGKVGNTDVKQMQSAILNFAKALASTPVGAIQSGVGQTHQRGDQQEYLGGTDPFGEFLTNHYINKKPSGGQQFVNVDLKSPTRTQTAIPNKSFKGIVSTIARIGTPGSESKPDGIWMDRTDNALHEIYDVGKALLGFASDLGIPIKGYSEKELNDFGTSIPKSYTDIKGRENEFAKAFTQHINALTQVANQFKKYVLENKQYSDYITQEKSFGKYDNSKPSLNADEHKMLQDNMKTQIPGVNIALPSSTDEQGKVTPGSSSPVTLQDISSIDNFKNYLKSLKINSDDPSEVNKYIGSIKSQLTQSSEDAGY